MNPAKWGIGKFLAVGKTRTKPRPAPNEPVRRIHEECAAGGHNYHALNTGYRCATCGNHMSSHEGELYGRAEDGRQERRRDPGEHYQVDDGTGQNTDLVG